MAGEITVPAALAFMRAHLAETPLCYSSAPPEAVQRAHARHGRAEVAERVESFFGDLAQGLADLGVGRLVVAGGETSGAVVTALGLTAFDIGPEIDPGVPALSTREGDLAIALKSGNFGGPDFFAKALGDAGERADERDRVCARRSCASPARCSSAGSPPALPAISASGSRTAAGW